MQIWELYPKWDQQQYFMCLLPGNIIGTKKFYALYLLQNVKRKVQDKTF